MKELRKSPETGLYLSIPQQIVSHRYSANIASPNASIHSKISETYVDFKNNLKVRYIARAYWAQKSGKYMYFFSN